MVLQKVMMRVIASGAVMKQSQESGQLSAVSYQLET